MKFYTNSIDVFVNVFVFFSFFYVFFFYRRQSIFIFTFAAPANNYETRNPRNKSSNFMTNHITEVVVFTNFYNKKNSESRGTLCLSTTFKNRQFSVANGGLVFALTFYLQRCFYCCYWHCTACRKQEIDYARMVSTIFIYISCRFLGFYGNCRRLL